MFNLSLSCQCDCCCIKCLFDIHVQVVRCLLIEPFPESALNEEAGKMLMEDYEGYAKHARYSVLLLLDYSLFLAIFTQPSM